MHDFGALSLLPALLAIGLAFWTRNVILSLFAAVWAAATLFVGGNPITGMVHAVDPLVVGAMSDNDHVKMLLFSLMVGGMVGVIGKSGGTLALVGAIARYARTRRSAQVMAWLSGLLVFFDDYANCLIVGNTLRPVTDRLRVSRAKLSYLVDSTAAPVAMLALVSTWVGVEVGYIHEGLKAAAEMGAQVPQDAYGFFVAGWGYRFYPILTLVFVGGIAVSGRDFGPMRAAERAALDDANAGSDDDTVDIPLWRLWLAVIPVLALILVTVVSLYVDGRATLAAELAEQGQALGDAKLFEILGAANSFNAMVKGSLAALVSAGVLSVAARALPVKDMVEAAMQGMREIFEALVVLILAWSLASSMGKDGLNTAGYLVPIVQAGLPAFLLPTLVFVVAAVTSFATGTSFGTMGILMPLVIPAAYALAPGGEVALAASGSVMAGACFGDHCSPISDTTILSSIGSSVDLVTHVRTQLPYALAVAGVAIIAGTLPAGLGLSAWVCLLLGGAGCLVVVRVFGRRPDATES